jgi:hypothetical protein
MIWDKRKLRAGVARRCAVLGWLTLLLALVQPAQAGESEAREFALSIDGRPAGTYRLDISRQSDGSTEVRVSAEVSVTYLIFHYTYSFHGVERWLNGRLVSLESNSNDDGKKFRVSAIADGEHIRVSVNGKTNERRWDVWTTTYWQLAPARYRNHGVPLLDADTGKYLEGALEYVNTQPMVVAGKQLNCSHYRITAPGIDVEAWYDARERLVRQTAREDGHRTVFTLTSLSDNTGP